MLIFIDREAEEIEVIKAAEEAALCEAEMAAQEAVAVAVAHGIITQVSENSSCSFEVLIFGVYKMR
jgi:hypothetical protein